MRKNCIVCGSSTKPIFHFPKNDNRRNLWIKTLNIKYATKHTRICAAHFSLECFRTPLKVVLNRHAVPNLLPSRAHQKVRHHWYSLFNMVPTSRIIVGNIIDCVSPFELRVIENGFIIVGTDGKILSIGDECNFESVKVKFDLNDSKTIFLKQTQLLLPGLIDTHIHAPQYPNVGLGYDKPLLEWLDEYTYNMEKQFKNIELCKKVFSAVVKRSLSYGTTTACYYGTLYRESTLVLADAVISLGQRALIGKVNMSYLAPEDYLESAEETIDNTQKFIEDIRIRRSDLVKPIITPRFALSLDMGLMKKLGQIARTNNLHIQTHIAENKAEVEMVQKVYPQAENYAQVYKEAGLLTPKTILAHGIYLSNEELKLLKQTGASISHCPESNTHLTSGLCDVRRLIYSGIHVGLGTDVAGGASVSIISAMKSAITVSRHLSFTKTNYTPLTFSDVFYLATLGGAKALAMENEIGNFVNGKMFDAIIVDLDVANASADLLRLCNPLELLQKFIYLGDYNNVISVFVNNKLVYSKNIEK